MRIRVQGMTDPGLVRQDNEDAFCAHLLNAGKLELSSPRLLLAEGGASLIAAVSDGMGGGAAGEVASATALEKLSEAALARLQNKSLNPDELVGAIEAAIQDANRAVLDKAIELGVTRPMGATLTVFVAHGPVAYLFQVGDSRAYLARGNRWGRITRDQSFVGHLVEMGTLTEAQAQRHPQRNFILQALGTQEIVKADVSFTPLYKGDWFLLCSDGLHGELPPEQLEQLALRVRAQAFEEALPALIDAAKACGGKDNITTLAISVEGNYPLGENEQPAYQPYPYLAETNPVAKGDAPFK